MSNKLYAQGIIHGMESMGAKYVKMDDNFIYFDVPISSEINDKEKLSKAKEAIQGLIGLGLKIKLTNP